MISPSDMPVRNCIHQPGCTDLCLGRKSQSYPSLHRWQTAGITPESENALPRTNRKESDRHAVPDCPLIPAQSVPIHSCHFLHSRCILPAFIPFRPVFRRPRSLYRQSCFTVYWPFFCSGWIMNLIPFLEKIRHHCRGSLPFP